MIPLVPMVSVLQLVASIVSENGGVTPAMALSPLSIVNPLMSFGLYAVEACSTIAPRGSAWTDQPSSGRSSSSTFPLQVSGRAVPEELGRASWRVGAVWPLAAGLIVRRYLTWRGFER